MSTTTTVERKSAAEQAGEDFQRDVAGHEMAVLRDDGLWRHLRFARPDRGAYWFEIVTWPGGLAVCGDNGGGYVFRRCDDMFSFFRANGHDAGINPGYWSEKLAGGREHVREYSTDVLAEIVGEHVAVYEGRYPQLLAAYAKELQRWTDAPREQRWPAGLVREPFEPITPAAVRERIADADGDGWLEDENSARSVLIELERAGVVRGTFEWNLTEWSGVFLWFCRAIAWGIARYDEARRDLAHGGAYDTARARAGAIT